MPRAANSRSSSRTAVDISPSPGTLTAHSSSSRNSRVLIRQRFNASGVSRPISITDQNRASRRASSIVGAGPRTTK